MVDHQRLPLNGVLGKYQSDKNSVKAASGPLKPVVLGFKDPRIRRPEGKTFYFIIMFLWPKSSLLSRIRYRPFY